MTLLLKSAKTLKPQAAHDGYSANKTELSFTELGFAEDIPFPSERLLMACSQLTEKLIHLELMPGRASRCDLLTFTPMCVSQHNPPPNLPSFGFQSPA